MIANFLRETGVVDDEVTYQKKESSLGYLKLAILWDNTCKKKLLEERDEVQKMIHLKNHELNNQDLEDSVRENLISSIQQLEKKRDSLYVTKPMKTQCKMKFAKELFEGYEYDTPYNDKQKKIMENLDYKLARGKKLLSICQAMGTSPRTTPFHVKVIMKFFAELGFGEALA